MYSKMIQLYIFKHPFLYILFHYHIFSIIISYHLISFHYHRILNITPCAIQQDLGVNHTVYTSLHLLTPHSHSVPSHLPNCLNCLIQSHQNLILIFLFLNLKNNKSSIFDICLNQSSLAQGILSAYVLLPVEMPKSRVPRYNVYVGHFPQTGVQLGIFSGTQISKACNVTGAHST